MKVHQVTVQQEIEFGSEWVTCQWWD